jgi:hypothetical protein
MTLAILAVCCCSKSISKVTKLDIGCGSVPGTPGMNVEKLTWNPVPLEAWIKECGPDFEDTFLAWGLGVGYKRPDLREAVIKIQNGLGSADVQTLNYWNEFMQDMMEQAIRDDIFRIGFFGDPAITAAQLTGGSADVANYNQLRGLWPQIIALATTCPAVRAATIAANQSADQLLPDGEATKVFTKRFSVQTAVCVVACTSCAAQKAVPHAQKAVPQYIEAEKAAQRDGVSYWQPAPADSSAHTKPPHAVQLPPIAAPDSLPFIAVSRKPTFLDKLFGHTPKTTIYPGLLPVKAGNKSTVNIFPGHGHHHHGRQEGRRRHS